MDNEAQAKLRKACDAFSIKLKDNKKGEKIMENYKYVRTTEGIVYVGDCKKDENGDYCSGDNLEYLEMKHEYIIKESDNLEDLCDEFILFDNENKIHYQSQEGSIWWLGAALYSESIRGAIFTNKGIIYVVKMNENNKLELI